MSQSTIQMMNVTKKIGQKSIIEDMSFAVEKGEIFGLLGPNGAGKTMTIRMMVGLIAITAGEILIQGHSIKTDFTQAIAHVGAIVENPELYSFLTGYQNLLHFSNLSPGITKNRIGEVVDFLGMERYIDDKVAIYSLGMRQRLGIAQALLHRPSVLILDEPTNGLDPAGIKELREYLRHLAEKEGVSIIVSSHILAEMELMCDRVAIIKKGRLLDVRSLSETAQQTVWFDVEDPLKARGIVEQNFPGLILATEGKRLKIGTGRENTARINASLVGSGIRVYGIETKTRTLEEIFMEVTVDGGIEKTNPK